MVQRLACIVVTAGLFLSTATHATESSQIGRPAAKPAVFLDEALTAAVTRKDVPGVVAMAANRGGLVYQGAFGMADVAHARPMTLDAILRIASMTKAITSVAAMQLVERGRIGLDDPVEKYLPDLAHLSVFESFDSRTGAYTVRPVTKTLTVRNLLTHTSGLGYNFTSPIVRDFKPRDGERYAAGPLLFEPGERWLYGTSTDWVGRLVESVSGKTLDEYFRERILGPLGMSDTLFNVPENKYSRLVTVHRRQSDGTLVEQANQPTPAVTEFNGGGGLSSTAGDYIRFMRMLLNHGQLGGVRILSADTVALMGRNHIGELGVGALKTAMPERSNDFTFINDGRDKWGLGFLITTAHVTGKRSAGSLSWGGINNTYFWIDPARGVAGVIMMQFLPFADAKALALYDAFERGVYHLAGASK
jgi:CubicO group peptidase (beta-lactamase class C family)